MLKPKLNPKNMIFMYFYAIYSPSNLHNVVAW